MVTRFEWERAVRRLDLRPPVRKLVALLLATYANRNGTNAHPGEDRLAQECGITTRATRSHLAALRSLGLVVRTFKGGGGRGADEYDLALPPDIGQRIGVLPLPVYRHPGSGSDGGPTGTLVPVDGEDLPERGTQATGTWSAGNRNVECRPTGTTVPPINTETKDVDHSLDHDVSEYLPHPESARATPRNGTRFHRFAADASGATCDLCSLPEAHPCHTEAR